MTLSIEQRQERLGVQLYELGFWLDRAHLDLEQWSFNGEVLPSGRAWPLLDGVSSLEHPSLTVPEEWPLEHTRLHLDLGGEGLVRIEYADGGNEAFGLDPEHRRFPLRERAFSPKVEAVARLPFGVPNRDPRLKQARLVWVDVEVERLERRLRLALEASRVLGAHEIVEPLLTSAELALASLEWPSATANYLSRTKESLSMREMWALPEDLEPDPEGLNERERASVVRAGERLARDLESLRELYPQQGSLALTGHAHIDLAWLWPMEETRRKAQRTFHTAIGLMDRYPEFKFNQSTAQLYAFLEQDDPALFDRIREKVEAGQWEPIGGMWVEPDANMPAGESLVRQLLYGQRYFRRAFGSTHNVCWMPDCFGFTPALPQLLQGAGIENFFTVKVTWSETNEFPQDLFWWEGLDGSRVLGHTFDCRDGGYNAKVSPLAAVSTWSNYRGKHKYPESLLSVGYGDGGGGVTEDMLENTRELELFPSLPSLRFTRVGEFYERARDAIRGRELPVWVGEIYLELHRGTFTTQARTKYLHRRAERDLIAAEVLMGMNALLGGEDPTSLEPYWQILLRNQFHDILPGSSIREVYETAEAELSAVGSKSRAIIGSQLDDIAGRLAPTGDRPGLLVVNPDLSPRPLRVELNHEFPGAQPVEGGSVLSGTQTVPALGARVALDLSPEAGLSVSPNHLENTFVRVTLDETGCIASICDKRADREVLDGRGNQLWVHEDKPRAGTPKGIVFDAWEMDTGYTARGRELRSVESVEVVESGPHRAAIRIERRFRDSRITQDIRLWANSARIEFKTTVDWHDRHWLLKARFPLAVRSRQASFETAFGVVERPTHRNTSWDATQFEVAGHRFADLSEPGYGVALLNDGKYGHHVLGNELGITLLRSPTFPDALADEGEHTFTYALYPHRGRWLEGGVLMEAEDLNRPLLPRRITAQKEHSWEALRLAGLRLGLGTLKTLEDGGGLVLRAYEPQGARGNISLELSPEWTLESELNLLEEPAGEPSLEFAPFQVRSWRLVRDRKI